MNLSRQPALDIQPWIYAGRCLYSQLEVCIDRYMLFPVATCHRIMSGDTMRVWANVLLAFAAVSALVLAWGYWYSLNHASLQLRVDDYSLKSERQAYGAPHGVTLELRDNANVQLAVARSVEPQGYILAVHPSADIGNCEHRGIRPSSSNGSQGDYATCYEQYSAWSATWAPRVHSADVSVGSCQLRKVPVTVHSSNSEWFLWWVPLPHVGGLPRKYFDFAVAIDSRACAVVTRQSG